MKPLLYKVNTNFFKTPLNKGFQRVLLLSGSNYRLLKAFHLRLSMRINS